jgi:hypothetical protein
MEIIESQTTLRTETSVPGKHREEGVVALRRKGIKLKDRDPITVCIPWEQKRKEITGEVENEEILRRVWRENESLAHTFIWHCLVSF